MINYNDIINNLTTGKEKKYESALKDYIKTDIIGNTITGRFLPDLKTIIKESSTEALPYTYHHHGWKSKLDGTGMFLMCANNWGEKCPICTQSIKMWRSNDEIQKKASEAIRRRTNYLVNFYVIDNPNKKEDNGKVKIFRFGKQMHDKYLLATEGADKKYYGNKIWKLDFSGCSFRIMCEATTDNKNKKDSKAYPTYNNSGFLPADEIEGMTPEKINAIYDSVFELPTLFKRNTPKELQDILDKHFLCNDVGMVDTSTVTENKKSADSDIIPPVPPTAPLTQLPTSQSVKIDAPVEQDEIDAILNDLNN